MRNHAPIQRLLESLSTTLPFARFYQKEQWAEKVDGEISNIIARVWLKNSSTLRSLAQHFYPTMNEY